MAREKWCAFQGLGVFDHQTKRFWRTDEIKELAMTFWKDTEMPFRHNNSDLAFIFEEEFYQFTDKETNEIKYWDDEGSWELVKFPSYLGFGIWEENDIKRIQELIKELRK